MDILKTTVTITGALAPCLVAAGTVDRTKLPIPDIEPQTYTQLDVRDVQRPEPTRRIAAPKDAPNVLVILLDDVGFSQSSLLVVQLICRHLMRWLNKVLSITNSIQPA